MMIHGVTVDVAALSGVKSLTDLEKSGIYDHLAGDEQKAAYKELFEALKPAKVAPEKD